MNIIQYVIMALVALCIALSLWLIMNRKGDRRQLENESNQIEVAKHFALQHSGRIVDASYEVPNVTLETNETRDEENADQQIGK